MKQNCECAERMVLFLLKQNKMNNNCRLGRFIVQRITSKVYLNTLTVGKKQAPLQCCCLGLVIMALHPWTVITPCSLLFL